jgi:hypothetical protein
MDHRIRWGRIILAAFLLEVAITAVALPVGAIFGNPMNIDPSAPPADGTVFYVTVALACFALGAVFGYWGAARSTSQFALHGLLVGLVAMAMYFGLCSLAPGGLAGVIAGYGLTMFVMFNVLRTVGCWAGGMYLGSRRHG